MKNKQKLNILIIDDETIAAEHLKEITQEVLENHENLYINSIQTSNNLNNYLDILDKQNINILFLDINMPVKNGIEIAKEIKNYKSINKINLPIICFTTAYNNFALQAFEQDVTDYILKPISDEKLLHFFNKIANNFIMQSTEDYIIAPTNGVDVKISLDDIYFLKSEGKYVSINTAKKSILILESITNLEQKFSQFVKIHRSYMVNKDYINNFYKEEQQWYVNLKQINKNLPVSRRQKVEIEGKLSYKIFED